jgi:hypothetical protein
MRTTPYSFIILATATLAGCSERSAQAEKAQQDADAKARAEAVRKESEAVPKTFSTPNYFEKNDPKREPRKEDTTAKTKNR